MVLELEIFSIFVVWVLRMDVLNAVVGMVVEIVDVLISKVEVEVVSVLVEWAISVDVL